MCTIVINMVCVCPGIAEILQANDSLTQVINLYRQLVKGEEMNGEITASRSLPGVCVCVCALCIFKTAFLMCEYCVSISPDDVLLYF